MLDVGDGRLHPPSGAPDVRLLGIVFVTNEMPNLLAEYIWPAKCSFDQRLPEVFVDS
jgi:hypothetical protein